MKSWFFKHHRHSKPTRRSVGLRCARRLTIERCEDRLLLSGESLAAIPFDVTYSGNLASASFVQDGGYIMADTSGLLQGTAHLFLQNDISTLSFTAFQLSPTLLDFDQISGDQYSRGESVSPKSINSFDLPKIKTLQPSAETVVIPADNPLVRFKSDTPSTNDLNLSLIDWISNEQQLTNIDAADRDFEQLPQGLPSSTPELLVINDPIQIYAGQLATSELASQKTIAKMAGSPEGGALEVAQAVTLTQRAYEMQLSANLANNLDYYGKLPASATPHSQPLTAELARAVAFETVGTKPWAQFSENGQAAEELNFESPTNEPVFEPVSAQQKVTTAKLMTTPVASVPVTTKTQTAIPAETPNAEHIAERLEDEQQISHTTTFAQWPLVATPLLATMISGYLLAERQRRSDNLTIQVPPRRQQ